LMVKVDQSGLFTSGVAKISSQIRWQRAFAYAAFLASN